MKFLRTRFFTEHLWTTGSEYRRIFISIVIVKGQKEIFYTNIIHLVISFILKWNFKMKILQTKMLRKILGLIFNHYIMIAWFLAFALGKYQSKVNSKVSKISSMNIALLGGVIDFEQVCTSWIIVFMLHVYLLIHSFIFKTILVEAVAQRWVLKRCA